MNFYHSTHCHYCGIDLHARRPEPLLATLEPFRDDLLVGVKGMHCWYWISDLCEAQGILFIRGHVLNMKAIHDGKTKNDRIDSFKIAMIMRGGNFPLAFVYPKAMPATCDLLRRRTRIVRPRLMP